MNTATDNIDIIGPSYSNFVRSLMIICEEKGITYTVGREHDGNNIALHSVEHFALHPYGKVPIVRHKQQYLIETASIARYLDTLTNTVALQPSAPLERARCDQWCAMISIYIDQAIMRKYLVELVFPKGENGQPRFDKIEQAKPDVIKALEVLSTQLADNSYICGETFTLADALVLPILDYLDNAPDAFKLLHNDSPLGHYLQRQRTRPSVQRALLDKPK